MENAERQIIERIRAGELDQFGLLYDRYIKKIYDFIFYKTFHKQTAEDLTSQTFIKALKSINSFEAKNGSVGAWLYTIARNTVIDHYRTTHQETDIEDVWDLKSTVDVEREIGAKLELEKVKIFLQTLTVEQREIVTLRLWDQLSYKEIAQILGKTEESCKMSFSRTMTKIKQSELLATLLLIGSLIRYY